MKKGINLSRFEEFCNAQNVHNIKCIDYNGDYVLLISIKDGEATMCMRYTNNGDLYEASIINNKPVDVLNALKAEQIPGVRYSAGNKFTGSLSKAKVEDIVGSYGYVSPFITTDDQPYVFYNKQLQINNLELSSISTYLNQNAIIHQHFEFSNNIIIVKLWDNKCITMVYNNNSLTDLTYSYRSYDETVDSYAISHTSYIRSAGGKNTLTPYGMNEIYKQMTRNHMDINKDCQ